MDITEANKDVHKNRHDQKRDGTVEGQRRNTKVFQRETHGRKNSAERGKGTKRGRAITCKGQS